MSTTLKEIHIWLFKKIQQVNKRILEMKELVEMVNPETVERLWAELTEDFGQPLDLDVDLEAVVDINNTNEWLKKELVRAESREAIFIKKIIATFPNDYDDMIKGVFEANAMKAAYEAKESNQYRFNNAFELQKVLNEYWLSSMPCVARNSLLFKGEVLIECAQVKCPKAFLWEALEVDKSYMQKIYFNWVKLFITTLNPGYF